MFSAHFYFLFFKDFQSPAALAVYQIGIGLRLCRPYMPSVTDELDKHA